MRAARIRDEVVHPVDRGGAPPSPPRRWRGVPAAGARSGRPRGRTSTTCRAHPPAPAVPAGLSRPARARSGGCRDLDREIPVALRAPHDEAFDITGASTTDWYAGAVPVGGRRGTASGTPAASSPGKHVVDQGGGEAEAGQDQPLRCPSPPACRRRGCAASRRLPRSVSSPPGRCRPLASARGRDAGRALVAAEVAAEGLHPLLLADAVDRVEAGHRLA